VSSRSIRSAILLKDSTHDFEHTQTGIQGLEVSASGLGFMSMSQSYGPGDEGESIATLHRANELECTFFDTAQTIAPAPTRSCATGRSRAA
jgi:hypothetical protein